MRSTAAAFAGAESATAPLRQMLTKLAKGHFYVETETGRGWWKLVS
jgi:hypothetical protein